MIIETDIEEILKSGEPVIDVRSPGEFARGHIPRAVNIPLFSDEERAQIGTEYTLNSKEKAMELGHHIVYPKLSWFISRSLEVAPGGNAAIHCWRGGMRSHAFGAWLHENGFSRVKVVRGGYKSYRNHILSFFASPLKLKMVGGYTGSGKTSILRFIKDQGFQAIDLEAIAVHRGSAFGSIGPQPTTEQFENALFEAFRGLNLARPIWLEDESRNIGGVNIPNDLYQQMVASEVFFLEIPRKIRSEHLVGEYKEQDPKQLAEGIRRIARRLGGENTRIALGLLDEMRMAELASLILGYYDKKYIQALKLHPEGKVHKLHCNGTNPEENGLKILLYDEQIRRNQVDQL